MVLVGNKCDRNNDREVTKEQGTQLAKLMGCEFLEASAKTAVNVEKAFYTVVRAIRQKASQSEGKKKKKKCLIL